MSAIPQRGEFCWNELMTSDVNKAKDFYKNLFGWTYEDNNMGDFTYTMFKAGERNIGGMVQTPPGYENQIPSHWMGYVLVDNIDDSVKKAQTLGATIKVPVTTAGDYGRFSIIIDPTGAHIALWQVIK